eukprot:4424310-Amphidinium_carterae.2
MPWETSWIWSCNHPCQGPLSVCDPYHLWCCGGPPLECWAALCLLHKACRVAWQPQSQQRSCEGASVALHHPGSQPLKVPQGPQWVPLRAPRKVVQWLVPWLMLRLLLDGDAAGPLGLLASQGRPECSEAPRRQRTSVAGGSSQLRPLVPSSFATGQALQEATVGCPQRHRRGKIPEPCLPRRWLFHPAQSGASECSGSAPHWQSVCCLVPQCWRPVIEPPKPGARCW